MVRRRIRSLKAIRHRLYEIIEQQAAGDLSSLVVRRLIVSLILINLVAVACESVPHLADRYGPLLDTVEVISLVVFSLEYCLRVWTAVEHTPHRHLRPRDARLKFVFSAWGLIDLFAVLPFWLALFASADLRVALVFRIVRFLKLARYSPGMRSLLDVLYAERRALFGCLVILMGATFVAASLMYVVERHAQPDKFGTIPDAMWWAIVTLGTIGYGDVVPVTVLGRLVATATIFTGLIMVALPVGIVATAFADQIHRRDFVVTWGMVARVPLFAELNAANIAEIMRLLRAQRVAAGEIIARRGDPAHSMYFISSGEVEIQLDGNPLRLEPGHFFGEIAALRSTRRSATISAVTSASLLVLEARDLHALMEREPSVAAHIRGVMRTRLGPEKAGQKGDLLSEEIQDARDSAAAN
jgi:voltage-gated potassium channel